MTAIDVTPLALAARRLDVSATLRAFTAFAGLLFVSAAAIGGVASMSQSSISAFAFALLAVTAAIVFAVGAAPGFASAWASTSMPGWRRGLAIVAGTLALFAVGGIAAAGLGEDRRYIGDAFALAAALAALAGFVWATPVLTLIADELGRRPIRWLSRAIATGAGAIAWAIGALLLVSAFVLGVEAIFRSDVRYEIYDFFRDAWHDARDVWDYSDGVERLVALLATPLVVTAYLVVPIWLLRRAWQVERELSRDHARAVLLGDVSGQGFFGRLAYQFGLPSSMWRASALLAPATWLFLFARPIAYLSILFLANPATGGAVFEASEDLAYDLVDAWFGGDFETPVLVAIVTTILLAPLLIGHGLFALGKRLAARRVWAEDGAGAGGDPVLFLRSFEDDRFDFRRPWRDLAGRWLDLWAFRRNADELLIDEFAKDGPVIALGKPDDKRAPFGAARRYPSHDEWQAVIEATASRARAIVVAAGQTPGLMWEYGLIQRAGLFDKTIVMFPPAADVRDAALARFREAFPDAAPAPVEPGRVLIAWRRTADGDRWIVADQPRAQAYLVVLRQFMLDRAAARDETANPYLFTKAAFRPLRRVIPFAIAGVVAFAAWFWWEEMDGEYVVEDSIDWLADKGGLIGAIVGAEPELYTPPPLPTSPPPPAPQAYQFQPGEPVTTIYFETQSSALTEFGWTMVDQTVQALLQQSLSARFEVVGHVDAAEAALDAANGGDTLASARAQAVLDALIASGAPADRLGLRAAGAREPQTPSAASEPLNRRVSVIVAFGS